MALRFLARANRFSRTPSALAKFVGTTRTTVSEMVEGMTKQRGRPDLTRPKIAALLGRIFDVGALNELPPRRRAIEIGWPNGMSPQTRPTNRSCTTARNWGQNLIGRRSDET